MPKSFTLNEALDIKICTSNLSSTSYSFTSLLYITVYYQLRQLRLVVRSITQDAAMMVVHAIISSRLDYCNSLLCGISGNLLQNSSLCRMPWPDWSCELEDGSISHQFCGSCTGYQFDSVLISRWLFLCTRRYTASFHSTWLKIVSSWPTSAADHYDPLMSWLVPQREHVRVSETGVFSVAGLSGTLCLSHYVTEPSHLNSLRDFWRHFGLCRAVAHSDGAFFAPYKYSYLLAAFPGNCTAAVHISPFGGSSAAMSAWQTPWSFCAFSSCALMQNYLMLKMSRNVSRNILRAEVWSLRIV